MCVVCNYIAPQLKCQPFEQVRMIGEHLAQIYFENAVSWDSGGLLAESTMDEYRLFNNKADMPEPIDFWQFVPIRGLCIVYIQVHWLSNYIVTTSHNHQQRTNE